MSYFVVHIANFYRPFQLDSVPFKEAIVAHFNGVPKPWDPEVPVKDLLNEYGVLYNKWIGFYKEGLDLIAKGFGGR